MSDHTVWHKRSYRFHRYRVILLYSAKGPTGFIDLEWSYCRVFLVLQSPPMFEFESLPSVLNKGGKRDAAHKNWVSEDCIWVVWRDPSDSYDWIKRARQEPEKLDISLVRHVSHPYWMQGELVAVRQTQHSVIMSCYLLRVTFYLLLITCYI